MTDNTDNTILETEWTRVTHGTEHDSVILENKATGEKYRTPKSEFAQIAEAFQNYEAGKDAGRRQ